MTAAFMDHILVEILSKEEQNTVQVFDAEYWCEAEEKAFAFLSKLSPSNRDNYLAFATHFESNTSYVFTLDVNGVEQQTSLEDYLKNNLGPLPLNPLWHKEGF